MKILECNDTWKVKIIGENVDHLNQDFIETSVPSSIYGTLLEKGLIPDPFYRDNELTALKLMENDFEYQTTIVVTEEMLTCDALLLTFEGIDTIADIYVNDSLVGQAYNMFRTWEFDILDSVSVGENTIRVIIYSPTRYIREENEKVYTGGSTDSMEGYPHLRKAHCMFGWDWGPRLPDAGIFRKVFIKHVKEAMLDSVYITQNHEENLVKLDFTIDIE